MANVKVKGLFDNFFIKSCSLRRNKTWYKMRKMSLNLSLKIITSYYLKISWHPCYKHYFLKKRLGFLQL